MDTADEHDVENPGGMSNGATNGAHGPSNGAANGQHPTPEGSLSYREEGDSDLEDEVQDEDDLLQPQLPCSSQSPLDIVAQAATTSSLANLNNLLNMHPQIMAKLRLQQYNDAELTRNGLEALQAAITSNLSLFAPNPYMSSPPPPPPPPPPLPLPQQQQQHLQNNHAQAIASNLGNVVDNQPRVPAATVRPFATSQTAESPQRSCRNDSESSQGSARNNGESRECEPRGAASANNQHPAGANWNFEEQFRQVRQLYEIDENPERKEFLDNLFSFMQQRGTPINRLPIMAKSVLDLFELYKLVVMRGGLVEVINKKLWQEIIKGLRLPASITSAAFTLRTQYMKYLYPYEQQKENLSTQEQLQTAIETNRRESRRGNYSTYATNNDSIARGCSGQHNSLPPNSLPLPMQLSMSQMDMHGSPSPFLNGHPQQHAHNSQQVQPIEYMAQIRNTYNKMLHEKGGHNAIIQQGASASISPPTTEAFGVSAIELTRQISLWNMYQNNNKIYPAGQPPFSPPAPHSPLVSVNSPEPQREALDLANSAHRSDPVSSPSASRSVSSPPSGNMRRNHDATDLSPPTSMKRPYSDEENTPEENITRSMRITQTVSFQENGRRSLIMTMEIDGVLYEGVLSAKNDDASSTSSNINKRKRTRNSE